MHLHTYHINTDKAASAKQARQTAAVNSQLDLRQSRMATEPTNVFFMEGMLEHEENPISTENEYSSSIDYLVWWESDFGYKKMTQITPLCFFMSMKHREACLNWPYIML